MYNYRKWTAEQQKAALAERQAHDYPPHSPPHIASPENYRIISAACFEHKPILNSPTRLAAFEQKLLEHIQSQSLPCAAWVVLPNHYHLLVKIPEIKSFTKAQGQLHGRTSFEMNREDNQRGRQIWCKCEDRVMRSERHYFTTINYIHNNPVKHRYVDKWGDWPYSSVHWYLENKGRQWLVELWHNIPSSTTATNGTFNEPVRSTAFRRNLHFPVMRFRPKPVPRTLERSSVVLLGQHDY